MPLVGAGASCCVLNTSTPWTPVVASSTGAIGEYSAQGTFTQDAAGKVWAQALITISDNGTAGGYLSITGLPILPKDGIQGQVFGDELAVLGVGLCGPITTTEARVRKAGDGGYPGAPGAQIRISLIYQGVK